jgi:succinate dehydrogenase/fumarate reductase cytochrome b subunit
MATPRTTADRSADALPTSWQRLLALSGIAFAVLLVVGFFLSGANTPDYTAADQEWTNWADDNELRSRIGGFLTLIAGFVFLHFAGTIRSVLGTAEASVRGSGQLARTAFAGAVTGITGITLAIVMIAGATAGGADADPVVIIIKAVAAATVGPFLVGAMGFAALLGAAGLLTLRSGVFARWIGIVALVGAVAFFITFFTVLVGPGEDSVFGYGFFVGFLALAIWSIATSVAAYRAVATTAQELPATEADS